MVGLTPLAAIPLLARSGSPVVWGQPGDLQGWWWIASGQLYRNNLRFPLEPQHVTQVFRVLSQQVAWLCLPLILGALKHSAALQNRFIGDLESNRHLVRSDGCSRPDPTQAVRPLVAMTIGLYTAYSLLYHTADASVFLLPAILLLAILIAPALRLAGIGAFVLPVTLLLFNFQTLNASRDHQLRPLAESILAVAPENAILLTPGDRSIFSLWYFHHVEDQRPDVILVDSNLFAFSWYRQRLEELYPDLHGLAADNLLRFRETNQHQRPVCEVNLVDNESDPAGIRCDEK
jgi:hypothetical protein